MQIYNNTWEITVNSANHGKRKVIIAARSIGDAWSSLEMFVAAWVDDEDIVVTWRRPSTETFIAVTDAAFGEGE